jgi:Tfp pilus assembly protein PilF
MVLIKRGDMEEAAQQFQKELDANPQYSPAMYQLAYVRLQQHQATEATRLLTEVIKQQPTYSDAHYQLGKALLEQGDVNAATRELETSVQLHPTDYGYFQLSRAYARAGRGDDATEAERNFEKLKPKPAGSPGSGN